MPHGTLLAGYLGYKLKAWFASAQLRLAAVVTTLAARATDLAAQWKPARRTVIRISRLATKPRSLGDILQEFSQHRQLMQEELQKVIIGQSDVIEQIFAAIFTRGHCLLVGRAGPGQDADGQHAGPHSRHRLQTHSVHARPDAVGHHRHERAGRRRARASGNSASSRGRSSRTSCWPTKSTARLPRRRPRCCRPCKSAK